MDFKKKCIMAEKISHKTAQDSITTRLILTAANFYELFQRADELCKALTDDIKEDSNGYYGAWEKLDDLIKNMKIEWQ